MRAIDYFDKSAESYSARTAIIDGPARYTFRETREISERIARAMWASGLRSDERAAIYSPNDARVLFCMLGIFRSGAVWVPINTRNATEANVAYMNYVETSWLFYHASFRDAVAESFAGIVSHRDERPSIRVLPDVVHCRDVSMVQFRRSACLRQEARPS